MITAFMDGLRRAFGAFDAELYDSDELAITITGREWKIANESLTELRTQNESLLAEVEGLKQASIENDQQFMAGQIHSSNPPPKPTHADMAGELEGAAHLIENIAHNLRRHLTPPERMGLLAIAKDMNSGAAELRLLRQDKERLADELREERSPNSVPVDIAHLAALEFAAHTNYGDTCPACRGHEREDYGYAARGPNRGHQMGCWLRTALDSARSNVPQAEEKEGVEL